MLPITRTPDDLRAGEVDVAILGAPLDFGTGKRGAAFGPKRLRASDRYLGCGTYSDPHLNVMVDGTKELNVVDYGDAPIDLLSTERSVEPFRTMVRQIAETGAIPFLIGGDGIGTTRSFPAWENDVASVLPSSRNRILSDQAIADGDVGVGRDPTPKHFRGVYRHRKSARRSVTLVVLEQEG